MVLRVHEAFEGELRTFIIREWAVLARLKPMTPVKVALQRVLATEGVLSFEQGERGDADADVGMEIETRRRHCTVEIT